MHILQFLKLMEMSYFLPQLQDCDGFQECDKDFITTTCFCFVFHP